MKLKLKNKTNEPQPIDLTDGSAKIVPPLEEVIIDSWNIYKEEQERLTKFFEISLKDPVSIIEKVVEKNVDPPKRKYIRKEKKENENVEPPEGLDAENPLEEDINHFDDMEVS